MEKQTGKDVICVLLPGLTRIFLLSFLLLASPDRRSRSPRLGPARSSGSGEITLSISLALLNAALERLASARGFC